MEQSRDITHLLERLGAFEDRLSIKVGGLYASIKGPDDDSQYYIEVFGEFLSSNGKEITLNIELSLACYDQRGRVIGTALTYIMAEAFFGFETFELSMFVNSPDISKLRIFPKPM